MQLFEIGLRLMHVVCFANKYKIWLSDLIKEHICIYMQNVPNNVLCRVNLYFGVALQHCNLNTFMLCLYTIYVPVLLEMVENKIKSFF